MWEFLKRSSSGSWQLKVWVQPGAKRDSVEGIYQGCLKVKIRSPAVDNKANKALILFLSRILGVKKGNIQIVSGQKNRKKVLIITMVEDLDLKDALKKYI